MALDNVDFDIDGITADGARAIEGAASTEALNQVDIEFLGKRSALTRAHRTLGGLDPETRGRPVAASVRHRRSSKPSWRRAGPSWRSPSGRRPSWPTAST